MASTTRNRFDLIGFLEEIDETISPVKGRQIIAIMDNLSTYTSHDAEFPDLLAAAAVAVRNSHARGHLGLVDIEHRAALDQTIHRRSRGSDTGRPPGRASCCGV